MEMSKQTSARLAWQKPTVSALGSVEDVTTAIKNAGGYDGVEIQLQSGDIITGS